MDEPSTSYEDDPSSRQAEAWPSTSSSQPLPLWSPCKARFQPYTGLPEIRTPQKSGRLRVIVNRPLVVRLTKDIIETYQICNPKFKCCESVYVKRYLTNPSEPVLNDGFDNENSDLVLFVNLVLVNPRSRERYVVKDMLGQGTFGQVVKCWHLETNSFVAVKIIKNQPAYYHQALVEVSILATLNQKFDPEDKHHIVRMLDHFLYQNHLCISFEMLGVNLFELIKMNQFKGMSTNLIRVFSKQMLDALIIMKHASIIHCDLKPENILLCPSVQSAEIKIIDFGSACMETRTVYSYIQASRYYRSPEVLLGYPYTTAIDMWSVGCIVAELFLGFPLFPGASEFDLIRRMRETLGGQPPDYMLRDAKNANKFFKHVGSIHCLDADESSKGNQSAYQFLTEEEYEARELKKPVIGKHYFNYVKLEDIIMNYPHRKNLSDSEISQENRSRVALVDFLRGLIRFDPLNRWTPSQALLHPFITNEPLLRPYEPPPESPFIPVCQPLTVNHNPGSGHWYVAGLSPQVISMNRGVPTQANSYMQIIPFSYASSYGSIGSYGSYNDGGAGLGSSFEGYADGSFHSYYSNVGPSGLNIQAHGGGTTLGTSPDGWWRGPHVSHVNGLGVSPSCGNMRTMSLGTSPSQFTPPSSQVHISAGSPGMHCPTSPARSGVHGSPLGKAAAVCQYNRRRSLGQPGMMSMSPQEHTSSQQWLGHHNDGEGKPRGHMGSPYGLHLSSSHPSWPHQRASGIPLCASTSSSHQTLAPSAPYLQVIASSVEAASDKPECSSSIPNPGDWDPNYSDDLLLQDDNPDMSSLCSGVATGMRINHVTGSANTTTGIGRSNRGGNQAQPSFNYNLANHRQSGPSQYARMDETTSSARDVHCGYGRPMSKPSHLTSHPASQHSPSRLGQQSLLRSNNPLQMAYIQEERMHSKGPSYWNVGPRSPGKSLFAGDSSWGILS
ncbi:Dual specificity protein kinase [Nymphaea thermarum]|nr:Dual specificity protein kinase [Nymphaea thermarum]